MKEILRKMMRRVALFTLFVVFTVFGFAQAPAQPAPKAPGAPAIDVQFANTLIQLERAAQDANVALGRLRIEKWKADSDVKKQSQSNVDALQRNLSAALPELLSRVRQNPQDLAVNFKLYRNLSAVYDVLASVTESAGAFGPKDQYQALAAPVSDLDTVRRSLADRLEFLASSKEAELARYRAQAKAAAAAQVSAPPKKIIIDDNAPNSKTKKTKKKTTAKPQ